MQKSATKKSQSEESIRVCIRMRPLLKPYEDEEAWMVDTKRNTITSANLKTEGTSFSHSIQSSDPLANLNALIKENKRRYYDQSNTQSFAFDHVEGPDSRTQNIYNKLGRPIVKSVLDGYNGTIFMYGQTTSGKTYTMLGSPESPGVLPCAMRDIFNEISKKKDECTYKIWISYMEIYNENINDLLQPNVSNLKIQEDPQFGIIVNGLKQQQVWTFDQAIILMNYGEEHRKYRETSVHEHSSRSHTIFRVCVESYSNDKENSNGVHYYSCLNLVDLAGSERLGDIDTRSENAGETGYINKSLFVLANVINKLAEGKKGHIPYRDSKLTRILSHALGGNSLTAIICTVSPAAVNFYQTLSTLRFATRAKTVCNRPEINEIEGLNILAETSVLHEQINKLQSELVSTRGTLDDMALSKKEYELHLERANKKIRELEDENSFLKSKLDPQTYHSYSNEDPQNNVFTSSELVEKYQNLLDKFNEEHARRISLENQQRNSSSVNGEKNEINFMEKLLSHIEYILGEECETLNNSSWNKTFEKFAGSYKIELIALQNKYRDMIREEAKNHFPHHSSKISAYLTTLNARDFHLNNKFDNEMVSELMKQINSKTVFSAEIFNVERLLKARALPEKIEAELEIEFESCVKELSEQYDEACTKLEYAFRSKVNALKETEKNPRNGALNGQKQPNIMKITNDHQEKLALLSQQYELVLRQVENKYHQAKETLSSRIDPDEASFRASFERENGANGQRVLLQQDVNATKKPNGNLTKIQEESLKLASLTQKFKNFGRDKSKESAGYIYLWGSGKDGRLGNGSEKSEKLPVAITDIKFIALSCSYHHSAAISEDNRLYTWGRGVSGQLGTGVRVNEASPMNVQTLNSFKITQVACGWQHTIALTEEGKVFSWGLGGDGQLGHGNGDDCAIPEKIRFFDRMPVKKIYAGHSHSAAITETEDLYMWGCNLDYRLMIANNQNQFLPCLTELSILKEELGDSAGVSSVSLGVCHSAVITKNGVLFTAGLGTEGQLGGWIDEKTDNAIIISRSASVDRRLEDPSFDDSRFSDIERIEKYCYIYHVREFGPHNKAMQVSCGDNFTLVLNENQQVYSFGKGSYSRLGQSSGEEDPNIYEPRVIPSLKGEKIAQISAGCRHSACINQKAECFAWGFNLYDQLGMGDSENDYQTPTKISHLSNKNVKMVSCGYFHSGAIISPK